MDLFLIPLAMKRFIYLILIASLAVMSTVHFHQESVWFVVAVLSFSLIVAGNSFFERIKILVATLFVTIASIFFTGFFANHIMIFALCILMIAFFVLLFGSIKGRYYFSAFIVVFFLILCSFPLVSFQENLNRLLYIAVGFAFAIVLQIIFWPYFRRDKIQSLILSYLHHLKLTHDEIFTCFLNMDYPDQIYLYERKLHVQKNKCMQFSIDLHAMLNSMQKLKAFPQNKKNFYMRQDTLQKVISDLDQLFDILMEYGGLRYRVNDQSTFGLCRDELRAIKNEIDLAFQKAMNLFSRSKSIESGVNLLDKINEFEGNYFNVLEVASRDPLAFFLFIASLKAFNDKLHELLSLKQARVS